MTSSKVIQIASAFVVALFAALMISAQPTRPANFSLQVTGQVRYADSKVPAENVLVRIESFSGGVVGQMITDRTGKFMFNGLNGMQYVVTIHAPGYIDIREDVNLVTQNSAYINALLIAERSSNSSKPIVPTSLAVIDSNIPIEAQNEFSSGKAITDQGKKDKIKDAIPHFEKAVALYPKFLEAQLALGLAYMDLGQWDKAEAPLNAAIQINGNATTAYLALGQLYSHQKEYAKAEEVLQNAIKLNDASAEAHYLLASAYWEMAPSAKEEAKFKQDLERSWIESKRSLELDPNHAKAHLLAGNLLLRARRGRDALVHFERYLALEPKGEFVPQVKSLVEKLKQALAQEANSQTKKT